MKHFCLLFFLWSSTRHAMPVIKLSQEVLAAIRYDQDVDCYLRELSELSQEDLTKQLDTDTKKKVFWINVYNAFTVQLIIENYPLKSIKDLRRPWDQSFIEIGGEKITLNTIEHKILRPMGDPRIHFAIVCASQSCPKLLNHAYEPSTLEDQLKNVTTVFINDPLKNNINKSSVKISKIFKWFKTDFPKREAFIAFLNSYSNIKILAQADVDYLNYNWGLNE